MKLLSSRCSSFPVSTGLNFFRISGSAGLRLLALLLVLGSSGCVTKSQAEAQKRAAYLAGRRDAIVRMQQQQAESSPPEQPQQPPPQVEVPTQIVTLSGPVRFPVLPWNQNLTLSQAIQMAGYTGRTNPNQIVIMRRGVAIPVDLALLFEGQDVPLLPGDIVQIR
jgi:hypothetical protein